jgi:pSer/pThr/pTyr-binding forkhead associated (FHA) protein
MATLVVWQGPATGKLFGLGRQPLIMVGRDEQCDFQILDEQVSRRHFQVKYEPDDDCHLLIDTGSVNGVMINGHRIRAREEVALVNGDQITAGRSTIVYTRQNFDDADSAMEGVRRLGERHRGTIPGRE